MTIQDLVNKYPLDTEINTVFYDGFYKGPHLRKLDEGCLKYSNKELTINITY